MTGRVFVEMAENDTRMFDTFGVQPQEIIVMRDHHAVFRSGKRQMKLLDLNSIVRKQIKEKMDRQVKPALLKSHELIVANWKSDVGFQARKFISGDEIAIIIFPTGKDKKIWDYVDQGTRPHVILPRNAPNLVFKTGYSPKTLAKPARTVAGGGKATGPTVYAKKVNHPGTEAREFTKTIAEDIKPKFKSEIENAFRQAARQVQE